MWLCSLALCAPAASEGLVSGKHTPKPVSFFCSGAHTPMMSKLYHLPRISEFRCWVKNE